MWQDVLQQGAEQPENCHMLHGIACLLLSRLAEFA